LRSVILGGVGKRLVAGGGLRENVIEALEAPSIDEITDPQGYMFRRFAEQTKSDLRALAACIHGGGPPLPRAELAELKMPVLIAVGTKDTIAGSPYELAELIPNARVLTIPDRDHMLAVGDRVYKNGVLAFLRDRP
jgi:pimeloyl-ACP methyl ester carboxylesterase